MDLTDFSDREDDDSRFSLHQTFLLGIAPSYAGFAWRILGEEQLVLVGESYAALPGGAKGPFRERNRQSIYRSPIGG